MDHYICPRCEGKISTFEQTEHEDWHFAQDLQAEEQNGGSGGGASQNGSSSIPPPSAPRNLHPPMDSYQGDNNLTTQQPASGVVGGNGYVVPEYAPPPGPPPVQGAGGSNGYQPPGYTPPSGPPPSSDIKHASGINGHEPPEYAPPSGPPPSGVNGAGSSSGHQPPGYAPPSGPPPSDVKQAGGSNGHQPAAFAPPSYPPPPASGPGSAVARHHINNVIEAGNARARDEQDMQNALQSLQFQYRIYNSDIEPEHDTDYYCNCPIHKYQQRKRNRANVMRNWSEAVKYPGEKSYNDLAAVQGQIFGNMNNPYKLRVVSPYGYNYTSWGGPRMPNPESHARGIHQTIQLNNSLNREAQANIDAQEPRVNIWDDGALNVAMSQLNVAAQNEKKRSDNGYPAEKGQNAESSSTSNGDAGSSAKTSRLSGFRKAIGIKSSTERAVSRTEKMFEKGQGLRNSILREESGRWPDDITRYLVAVYQDKVGMEKKIADLRVRHPIQYLHLLKAGYFEPIPVAWATQASNPLKFSIEASAGYRGLTPAWRGYEDTAEERLYWVLNHREGSAGMRMKPDFISEMNMARDRMAKAVEPPPDYYSANDTCHTQHTSTGYSKQVMPSTFRPADRPEVSTDDTMLLLDVSGSMDFDPVRPNYNQYLITGYSRSTQPKNKDVAKAIIRRFTDAMANHDHEFRGYDLTTFSDRANFIGTINHRNLDQMWRSVRIGGGTRVMTGWQKVKEKHFEKHSESATHHPVYGWQAGPQTPMLRLLLLLDGEATDMDEFELELLGLSWAHVTIFLIGVDGCPHHHRHANELQRISDVNHHVSFVDAQGNTPERFVTHELLKRHLGYDISMSEFVQMEELPAYQE